MNKKKYQELIIDFFKSFLILFIFGVVLPFAFKKIFNIYFIKDYTNENVIFVNGILDKKVIFMYNLIYTLKIFLSYTLY